MPQKQWKTPGFRAKRRRFGVIFVHFYHLTTSAASGIIGRPRTYAAGRNFVNSKNSQIFHLIFRIFCEFCTIPETHGPCKTPYAPYPIAGRKRQCGPEFPLTRPYANFFVTNVARARDHEIPENAHIVKFHLTFQKFFGIILKKPSYAGRIT